MSFLGKIHHFASNYLYFLPILHHNRVCRKRVLKPLYEQLNTKTPKKRKEKIVIYMVLKETTFSGGLSDRFRGIVSIFETCQQMKVPFYIYFKIPNLEDYLVPNHYDWRISEEDVCYDTRRVYPCTILTYHSNIKNKLQKIAQKSILKKFIKKDFEQIHVFSNMVSSDEKYGELFHELFKPSKDLAQLLNFHLEEIGGKGNYMAMVFRFRQLLGDFKEGGDILPEQERLAYIGRCKESVCNIHNQYPKERILVTSDSVTFLNVLSDLPYVYVIPGNVVHVGFTFDADKKTYMKSFVDYFMLSYASRIFLVRDQLMYHSGFAYRAALLNGAVYDEIQLNQN